MKSQKSFIISIKKLSEEKVVIVTAVAESANFNRQKLIYKVLY